MSKKINIDGLDISVSKKRIKRINMRIKEPNGDVSVSAPYGTPDYIIIDFVRSKRSWIDRHVKRIRERAVAHPEPASKAEKESRRRDLKKRIAVRLPEVERATGLSCNGWTVRDMHSRWGSGNVNTHHINLSLMLATRSDEELDYVILHELVHTVVANHGPEFYAMMDRYMPEWKMVRKRLRQT